MSGSELWLAAQPRAELTEEDWAWLERWLGEMLGVPVRLIVTTDSSSVHVPVTQPVVLYGDRSFLESRRDGNSDARWIGVEATARDWLLSACISLRRGRGIVPNGVPTEAVLDRSAAELARQLDQRYPDLTRIRHWPPPYAWALVLTHDVDMVDRWSARHVAHLARHVAERWPREGLRAILRLPWAAVRGAWDKPPLARRLRECIFLEQRHGVPATYLFFAPLSRYRTAFDGWYTAKTRLDFQLTIEDLWEELRIAGFEVGLHLSIGAHADPERIAAEWGSLRARVSSLMTYRSHYLAEKPGVTAAVLAALGAKADLNVVASGFANGTGFPFSVTSGEAIGLYRVPTVVEDAALEMNDDPVARADYWCRCEAILEETRRNGSLATVLLHAENPGVVDIVGRLIDWAKSHNAWITSVREMITHWQARARYVTRDWRRAVLRRPTSDCGRMP